MENPTIHRVLVTTGCLMWCASAISESFQGQPYSTAGIIISPILTVTGVFYWFRYYRKTKGHYPKFTSVWGNIIHVAGRYTLLSDFLRKYVLEFWTFCILFWMGIVLIMVLTFRCSGVFEAIKNYCQTNQEILSQTGEIKYFGILFSGSTTSSGEDGTANISFTVVGAKGNFDANSKLIKEKGVWKVESLILR